MNIEIDDDVYDKLLKKIATLLTHNVSDFENDLVYWFLKHNPKLGQMLLFNQLIRISSMRSQRDLSNDMNLHTEHWKFIGSLRLHYTETTFSEADFIRHFNNYILENS